MPPEGDFGFSGGFLEGGRFGLTVVGMVGNLREGYGSPSGQTAIASRQLTAANVMADGLSWAHGVATQSDVKATVNREYCVGVVDRGFLEVNLHA